jgi:hypothetical protein
MRKIFNRHPVIATILSIICGFILFGAVLNQNDKHNTAVTMERAADVPSISSTETPKPTVTKKKVHYTKSQSEAIDAAKNYLSLMPLSKKGLIRQLSSNAGDGFPKADATFAVNHIKVDYNKQAYLSAQNYLELMSYSKAGLTRQLTSSYGDGFTAAQAAYAVKKVGL